jgi:HEAT repeat protein
MGPIAWKVATVVATSFAVALLVRGRSPGSSNSTADAGRCGAQETDARAHATGLGGARVSSQRRDALAGALVRAERLAREAHSRSEFCGALLRLATIPSQDVVAAFRRVAAVERRRDYRSCIPAWLATVPGDEAVELVTEFARDDAADVRRAALRVLAHRADEPSAYDAVMGIAQDLSNRYHVETLLVLAQAGMRDVAPLIGDQLASSGGAERVTLVTALGTLGNPSAIPELTRIATGPYDIATRNAALNALLAIPTPSAFAEACRLLNSGRVDANAWLAALGSANSETAREALFENWRSATGERRWAVLHALSHYEGDDIERIMRGSLHGDERVAQIAIDWLGAHGSDAAVAEIEADALATPSHGYAVIDALEAARSDAARTALAHLAAPVSGREGISAQAITTLGRLDPTAAAPLAVDAASRGDAASRRAALDVATRLPPDQATAIARPLLDDAGDDVACAAAQTLEGVGGQDAVRVLVEAAARPSVRESVRRCTADAIREMGLASEYAAVLSQVPSEVPATDGPAAEETPGS